MHINDPLGDMLTRIRNAQRIGSKVVESPSSTLRKKVLDVMHREGYIRGYTTKTLRKGVELLVIELKYSEGVPVIGMLKRISTPGRRTYSSMKDLKVVRNGLGISILSTSKGLLSDVEAREAGVGGEVICQVF
jgi:small subunit ribosomal protein S8